ncbi:glycosyltransferase [Epidermidibacterium keratini]|uniref:Glycosyltransferase n=1 Tax=Epidermidibacterium keratini TaxID=1891644 RepID=A0A7L4YQS1_9ACTN|nr:glycosyltransferase [Epidermidibacterium keratini]QHC01480.1 glycosyltransferase [Epidermidibacterium keratini]
MNGSDQMNTDDGDIGRKLLLDHQFLAAELSRLDKTEPEHVPATTAPGISVIVPTYHGRDRLGALLDSFVGQTARYTDFEVLVVCNGEDDGSSALLAEFASAHPKLDLRWVVNSVAGAGAARNLGLALASRDHVTFVDDDDVIEPRFLAVLAEHVREQSIVVTSIIDVDEVGNRRASSPLRDRIDELRGQSVPITQVPWVLGFNAAKLVPTELARAAEYSETLSSGEDVVYFAHLLRWPELTVIVPADTDDAAYLRSLRPGSVSRQQGEYDFSVAQRLACVRAIRDIAVPAQAADARLALERAQCGFAVRYLREHPEDADRVADAVARAGVVGFPWSEANSNSAKDLVFAYCFSPFSDTSAVVAAKAIAQRAKVVDVVSNDMSGIRRVDPAVASLAERWIDHLDVLDAPPSFSGWEAISSFATKAVARAESRASRNGGYETLYSRALWIGSHVAAAMYKSRHWQVEWSAEFSDPLRTDVVGARRKGDFSENEVSMKLRRALDSRGYGHLPIESLFDLVEAATLVLADQVIMTNDNQCEYMLSAYDDPGLRQLVEQKVQIRPHPTPPAAAYAVTPTSYRMPTGVVNIAYFGSFYPNRGIGEVLTAVYNLPMEQRRRVRLHIFCNKPAEVGAQVTALGVAANVYVRGYLPYLEFLNATTLFDVLLVSDVDRGLGMDINPFLPSKYSDYRGSGSKIWSLVDQGSPLSTAPNHYQSQVGNSAEIVRTLKEIVADSALDPASLLLGERSNA